MPPTDPELMPAHISDAPKLSIADGTYKDPPAKTSVLPKAVAGVLGILAGLAVPASALLPPPFNGLVMIVGFILAAVAGVALPTPQWAEGKPILQGTLLTVAGSAVPILVGVANTLPAGPLQAGAYALALAAALAAGKVAPQLGGGRVP